MLARWLNLGGARDQVTQLSFSARLLFVTLGIIVVMALILVSAYSGRTQLVPLGVTGGLSPEARTRAVTWLVSRNAPYDDGEPELMLRREDRPALLADLTEEQLITSDQINFKQVLEQDSVFVDSETRRQRYLIAKMNFVAQMIMQMEDIEHARVLIDEPAGPRGLGRSYVAPSAAVTVRTRREPLRQEQADAIASLVANAHAALDRDHVTVADLRTSREFRPRSEDDVASNRYIEAQKAAELHVRAKVEELLRVIPGAVVAVNAQVDVTRVVEHQRTFEDPKSSVIGEDTRERTMEPTPRGGIPDLRFNDGGDLRSELASRSGMTDTRETTQIASRFPEVSRHVTDPRGVPLRIDATVLIPRSYFRRIHERRYANAPTSETVDTLTASVLGEIKDQILPLIDTTEVGTTRGVVEVQAYEDDGPVPALAAPSEGTPMLAAASTPPGLMSLIGVGVLGVISLALMFMMVRRAARPEPLPTAEELAGIPPPLSVETTELVGEADASTTIMEGVEIADDMVRRQQIIEQINELATNASGDAAALLRKWVKSNA